MATDPAPRRGIDTATAVVEGAADGLADGIDEHHLDQSLPDLARQTAPIAQRGVRSERLRATLEKADEKVSHAIDSTRAKARAVAESARRARKAPANVIDDVKVATKAYLGGLTASIVSYAVAGVIGAIAFVVLTVGLVQGLNELWGKPWGALAVGVAYGIVALIFASVAKGKAAAGRRHAKLKITQARLEVQRVVEPVRDAFRREPAPTSTFGQLDDKTKLAAGSASMQPLAAPSDPSTFPSDETFPRT